MKRLFAMALALGAATAQAFSGVVTHVTDGDTLWIQPDSRFASSRHRKPIKLRLQGIDAPEICQAGGPESKAALASRVLHQHVEVQTRAQDSYKRTLGTLRLQGDDVNAWMVEHGHAWSDRYRRSAGPYAALEHAARQARLGVFAEPNAVEPRSFRKSHGPCH